ncbi:hypothetical protein IKG12_02545 [Candidatus Saccharibacteria bacterium]|nr:hypothetical protein [Candidatus Saccharibacteria bacterium]MBR3233715.1 hypothetical protein [Candidatus Saccharibacteria bacterium]
MKIYNVRENSIPRSTMYSEEIEATLAVAERLLAEDNGKCSFVLRGQADGGITKDLLQFDAGDGTSTPFSVLHRKADHLIDQLLNDQFEYDATSPEIIHRPNNTAALVLPTTHGSFLCSVATLKKSSVNITKLLVAIARALHRLSESDTVLKTSYDDVYYAAWEKDPKTPEIEKCVDSLFNNSSIQEIEAWKYWRKNAGDLALFFEEG